MPETITIDKDGIVHIQLEGGKPYRFYDADGQPMSPLAALSYARMLGATIQVADAWALRTAQPEESG